MERPEVIALAPKDVNSHLGIVLNIERDKNSLERMVTMASSEPTVAEVIPICSANQAICITGRLALLL